MAFVNADHLVRAPVWKAREAKLEHVKKVVGQALAQDMRKLWKDRAVDKKKDTFKGENAQLSELKQVEALKERYDAIERALAQAPKLQMMQGMSAGRPGELLVQDPRTGQVYLLYEYHVPGGYLGGDNGVDSDYDAVIAPSEFYGSDQKGDKPFLDPAGRNPLYQGNYGTYPEAEIVRPRGMMAPGALKVVPANRLYEWHVPGAGTSAEYLGGDNGVDSDYDEVSAPSEYFATDEKGDAPFENGINRVDNMQGTYHDYAGGGWTEMKPKTGAPQLYEYHVPGDYLGGDGGVDSDYDAVTAPSEFYGMDQKGDAAFGEHGFGAMERNPIYQGDYHEYEGGDWVDMKGAPQQLAQVPTQMMAHEAPKYVVMRDNAGQLRLVNPRAIEGLETRRLAQQNAQLRMAKQILAMRRQRVGVLHAKHPQPAAKKAFVPHKVVPQKPAGGHFISHFNGHAPPNKPIQVHAAKKSKKADAKTEMLAEAFDSSADRTWGKVYEPKLVHLSGLVSSKATHPLSGLAAKEFKRWDSLAQKVTDVYDPMKSDDENQQLMMGHNGNWWSAKGFQGHTGHDDAWWVHNKQHSANKAY
eukprot:Tamp_09281.p1 GENE.Tamp_09281~~Tamp_09281.p1  ORF type:complete len:634 (+),score=182.41 Tamp_09281:159-1904(+)